ncbi:MAG: bifunctional folylpolyglutamate synthase/dihydrofolate synthase [Deltaproteobacteria bacterium]|nr:bifunctional folylpolyglutamate synthase/dihydrofolate synthase [Deltaproteobacteria bacterium]
MTAFDLQAWLQRAQVQGIKLGLDNIRAALAALGDPQQSYPSLLVAGTNGKGSTVSMASAMLLAGGQRVGSTVSPHLTEYRERFLLDGVAVSQEALEEHGRWVATRLDPAPDCQDITFFELGVALALSLFAAEEVDCAVIEVGMGGEFDATRACGPHVLALTNVDMDHVRHLGPTLLDIARTKARAAPEGGVVVVGEKREDRLGPILEEVAAAGATLWLRGRDFSITEGAGGLRYVGPSLTLDGITLGLAGAHQVDNAAVALASVEAFCARAGIALPSDEALREGLLEARVPGRLERLPLGNSGAGVLLDGAHNPAGARALERELAATSRPRRRIWLYAAMNDKDRQPLVSALLPHVDEVWCTAGSSTPRFAEPSQLAQEIRDAGGRAQVVTAPPQGVERAMAALGPGDELLVAGSLYLVGDVRPRLVAEQGAGAT